ncbi:MAG: DUF2207 domain-containing protein [Microbacterium sp.]|uniref:DUF2207 domain-containing protein n=1 Tax=Microbacterium sp. TaxID=51671 RepID=UPI0039E582B3
MRPRIRAVLVVLAVAAAIALSGCAADDDTASADVDDFSFQSLDVDYTLSRADDGTSRLHVVETFVADFPAYDQNHGMRRAIPDSYNGHPLFPRLESITDADGTPRESETDTEDGVFTMTSRADDYVHGAQTYVFTYDLQNVTWSFADTGSDEFYWDVNGTDWPQAFGRVSTTLHLDADLAAALTGAQSCYVGAYGSTDACTIAGGAVSATAVDVGAYQTMTIAVGFAAGTFAPFDDSYLASGWSWLQLGGIALVLAGLAWGIVVRVRRLRDDPGRPVVIAEYDPPAIDAASSAVFLGKSAKAVPAEVLEQAVRGSIRIEEAGRRAFGGVKLKAVLVDAGGADADGRMLLDGLFGAGAAPGAQFAFGGTNSRLASAARRILAAAGADLKARGLYRPLPRGLRTLPSLLAVVGGVIAVSAGLRADDAGVDALLPLLLLILSIAAGIAGVVVTARRPLSRAGAELRDHLAGVKLFIDWAEADRIRMLQSPAGAERVRVDTSDRAQMLRIYEPLLPYAVVFGQERQWAEHLTVLYGEGASPSWYVGVAAFDAASFSAGIGSLSASAVASSSTSGGSAGGGSAGGGGGGGGGGGV